MVMFLHKLIYLKLTSSLNGFTSNQSMTIYYFDIRETRTTRKVPILLRIFATQSVLSQIATHFRQNCNKIIKVPYLIKASSLKEFEKLGHRKGVISQYVKDVVQSLVDDPTTFEAMSNDKIGTSAEMRQYAENDPTTFEAMKEVVKIAHEASKK
ncbi:hypothetical protein QVD17_38140 [Tagetes erecta]|uniref:Mnd1 HTH domain-containing protein n=1 Tax=Tagetes erecta TaxID=13708 RepID=A0AAD8NJU7_TARER|nr:hypothetical protein QVD17_38140 [Tagetes erecta]